MTDITENGLDLPKQQLVDQYLGQISDITSMITEAQNAAKMQMIENQYAGADLLSGDTFQNLQQSINQYTDEATKNIDESYQKILTSLNAQRLAGEKGMMVEYPRPSLTLNPQRHCRLITGSRQR